MLKTFFRPRTRPGESPADAGPAPARPKKIVQDSQARRPRRSVAGVRETWSESSHTDHAAEWQYAQPHTDPQSTSSLAKEPTGWGQDCDEDGQTWAHSRNYSGWAQWEKPSATQHSRSTGQPDSRPRRKREAASGGYRFGVPEALETLEDMQQQLEEATSQEQVLRERLRELEHELAQKCGKDGEDWGHRKSQLRAFIDTTSASVHDLREQRNSIMCGDDPRVREEQQTREDIKRFKASPQYATEEQLVKRIEELETLMLETNLQLREERKLLGEIQSLGRLKEEVRECRQREAALRSEDEIIRERLEETAAQLTAKVEELNHAEAELKRLEQEREETLANCPEAAERACVHHQLNEYKHWKHQLQSKIEQKERILARQRMEEEEARKREAERQEARERRAEQEERLRQLREERERQQQEARERRREEAALKATQQARVPKPVLDELPKEPPHFAELRLLEQTLAYCRKLLPKNDTLEKEKKHIEYNNPEGSLVIMPKEDRPDEFLFAPPKPRRHEGKVRKRPPTSKMKKTRTEGKQVLMHTPLSLQLFAELQIVPPVNTCDVPPTVDEVEERLATRRSEMAKWEEKRKELQARWLASELEKARLAQEEREQERLHRLETALARLEERQREVEDDEEASEDSGEALRSAVRAAENLGATASDLASAQDTLRLFTQQRCEAVLLSAMSRFKEAQQDFADSEAKAEAEKAQAPEESNQESEETEDKCPSPANSSRSELDRLSRDLRLAVKELEDSLRSAKQAEVASEHVEAASELLKAHRGKSEEPGPSAEVEDEAPAHGEDPTSDGEEGATPEEPVDDFVPQIVNLGDDDEEELVFDLGMG